MNTSYFVAMILIAFAATSHAEMPSGDLVSEQQANIKNNKEAELEADHDVVQIRDLEAEKKMAKEQALLQEQSQRSSQARLESVRAQRQTVLSKAKEEIANYESRRRDAEKVSAANSKEANKLQEEIKKTEESLAKAQKAANDAVAIMAAGKEELAAAREKRIKLEQQNRDALYAQTKAEGEMQRLREEWKRVNASIKDLENRIQSNEAEARKKSAMIAEGARKVAAQQARESQLKNQLGIKDAPMVAANPLPVAATSSTTTVTKPVVVGAGPAKKTCSDLSDVQCK